MNLVEEKAKVLKSLVDEYRENPNVNTFCLILKRADEAILSSIYVVKSVRPYLKTVYLSDLYNSAVVGLYNAIMNSSSEQTGEEFLQSIPREICRYIHTLYGKGGKEGVLSMTYSKCVDEDIVVTMDEYQSMYDKIVDMVEKKLLTLEKVRILRMRVVEGKTLKEIEKITKRTSHTISRWTKETIESIRNYEMERKQ